MIEASSSAPADRRRAHCWLAGLLAMMGMFALVLMLGTVGVSPTRPTDPASIRITAYPLAGFRTGSVEARFGDLTFLGGAELRSTHAGFAGISALRLTPDGERFLALTDMGDWLTGRIERTHGRIIGLGDVTIAPIIGPDGRPARDQGLWDSESIASDGRRVYVGIEREHTILAFPADAPIGAPGARLALPPLVRRWWSNRGIEALGILPERSAYAGRLIAISERSDRETTEGFVMPPDAPGEAFAFRVRLRDRFDITDLDFLPGGDMILLERYFSPLRGVAMRLRRIRLADIRPGATLDGDILLTASGRDHHVDNMETLSIRRTAEGAIIFTMVADDNASFLQRTLLLEFRYEGPP